MARRTCSWPGLIILVCCLRSALWFLGPAAAAFTSLCPNQLLPRARLLHWRQRLSSSGVARAAEESESAQTENGLGMDEETLEKMKQGAIVDPTKFGYACVAAAIVQGKSDEAKEMVEKGAPLEDRGIREVTALGFAAEKGDMDMVELLMERGAQLEARDQTGRSVLMLAAIGGHSDVIQYLIDEGADVEARDRAKLTALLWASIEGHAAAVRLLVGAGADVNAVDADGMTALKLAAVFNKVKVAKVLVKAGADPKPGLELAQKFSKCKETADFLATQVA